MRYLSNPRWGLAYWRSRRAAISSGDGRGFALAGRDHLMLDPTHALAAVTGAAPAECERALACVRLPRPLDGDPPPWWPRESLIRPLAALTRLSAARTVVEVGVARGYSSAAILRALEAGSPDGRLYSIDLPPLEQDARTFIGAAIAPELRSRWQLTLGPSREKLAPLARAVAPIDLFVHDGDHSYGSQREDLESIWPHLTAGAVAVVDDVWSTAVLDFAEPRGAPVLIIGGTHRSDAIALIRKPA